MVAVVGLKRILPLMTFARRGVTQESDEMNMNTISMRNLIMDAGGQPIHPLDFLRAWHRVGESNLLYGRRKCL